MALKVEDGTGKKVEGKGVGEYLVEALRALTSRTARPPASC